MRTQCSLSANLARSPTASSIFSIESCSSKCAQSVMEAEKKDQMVFAQFMISILGAKDNKLFCSKWFTARQRSAWIQKSYNVFKKQRFFFFEFFKGFLESLDRVNAFYNASLL
jgi:hypothetical protein